MEIYGNSYSPCFVDVVRKLQYNLTVASPQALAVTKARQGCLLSQYVFNLYGDAFIDQAMEIKVPGLTLDKVCR
jgi:hypothetical protein